MAKNNHVTVLLVVLMLIPAHSALSQEQNRASRTVDAFTEIEFAISGTLHLRQADTHSVEVDAPSDVRDRVETTVATGVLEVRSEDESGFFDWVTGDGLDGERIDVFVSAPTIEKLSLAGSGRIVGETPMEGESLSIDVAGSGSLDLDVAMERLDVHIAGSGTSTLRGRADAFSTNTAGSGDIRAADLSARTANVHIAGSGDVKLHVTDELEARILGSGEVEYRGSPSMEVRSLGSGEVRSIE